MRTLTLLSLACVSVVAVAQDPWPQFGRTAQHNGLAPARLQTMRRIIWQTPVDMAPQYSGTNLLYHYTPPMVSSSGMVVLPVKTTAGGNYVLEGHRWSDGLKLWTLPTDWVALPSASSWKPICGACLVHRGDNPNAGAVIAAKGGKLIYKPVVSTGFATSTKLHFLGLAKYLANQVNMDASVFVTTQLTTDGVGNVWYGYGVSGANTLGLTSGLARVNVNGTSTYRSVSQMTGGASTGKIQVNSGPALSLDGKTLYFVTNGGTPYIVGVDAQTLAPKYKAALKDPVNGNDAYVSDQSSACPTVAPDGQVFFGVLENPLGGNTYRGYMLRFSPTLVRQGVSGNFGWDDTAGIVPSAAVPSYRGPSNYLILTKYNNYAIGSGDGHNRLSVLDPLRSITVATPTSHPSMAEVLTVIGVTPDPPGTNGMVREWCVNGVSVDVAGRCALVNSEDGKAYKWDFVTNTLTEPITLTVGIGEAYTSTISDHAGRGYAISNGTLYVLGSY